MSLDNMHSYLKTFLEVSKIQIDIREDAIRRKNSLKKILDKSVVNSVNYKIMELTNEKNRIQGRLDCVKLEILDMILDDPSLVSEKMLAKKGFGSVLEFVKTEKENIELRGLYSEYPCSIKDVLNIVHNKDDVKITDYDVKNAVNSKNVKIMIKSL